MQRPSQLDDEAMLQGLGNLAERGATLSRIDIGAELTGRGLADGLVRRHSITRG